MTKNTPYYGLAAARTVVDPNPRDPGGSTNAPVLNLVLRQGPQPRDDGSHAPCSKPPEEPKPRDPGYGPRGNKRRERMMQPRDAGT